MNKSILRYILLGIAALTVVAAVIVVSVMEYSKTRTIIVFVLVAIFALTAVPASMIQYKIQKEEKNKNK